MLKKQITHVRRRRVTIEDLPKCINKAKESIFSLVSPSGEVNSYLLTFEEALLMVDPAIDEDGYRGSELSIQIVKD